MEQEPLPQNKAELKELIIKIVSEVNEDRIPEVSVDEAEEIEGLHGDSLDKTRDIEDYESL